MVKLLEGGDSVSIADNDLPLSKNEQESNTPAPYWHHLWADLRYSELHLLVAHYREFKNYPMIPVKDYIKAAIKWSYSAGKKS